MARGWESKAVADQVESRENSARTEESGLSATERARRAGLETLRLSRAHTLDQLARARHPLHRQMLERTLRALDAEEEKLRHEPA